MLGTTKLGKKSDGRNYHSLPFSTQPGIPASHPLITNWDYSHCFLLWAFLSFRPTKGIFAHIQRDSPVHVKRPTWSPRLISASLSASCPPFMSHHLARVCGLTSEGHNTPDPDSFCIACSPPMRCLMGKKSHQHSQNFHILEYLIKDSQPVPQAKQE